MVLDWSDGTAINCQPARYKCIPLPFPAGVVPSGECDTGKLSITAVPRFWLSGYIVGPVISMHDPSVGALGLKRSDRFGKIENATEW